MEQLRYSEGEEVRLPDGEMVELPFTPELLTTDGDDMLAGGGDLAQSFLFDSFDQQLSGADMWMSGTIDPSLFYVWSPSFYSRKIWRHDYLIPATFTIKPCSHVALKLTYPPKGLTLLLFLSAN